MTAETISHSSPEDLGVLREEITDILSEEQIRTFIVEKADISPNTWSAAAKELFETYKIIGNMLHNGALISDANYAEILLQEDVLWREIVADEANKIAFALAGNIEDTPPETGQDEIVLKLSILAHKIYEVSAVSDAGE